MVADILSRVAGGAILAVVGWGLGNFIADVWGPEQFIFWVFGLTIAGVVIGLVATPFGMIYDQESNPDEPAGRSLSSRMMPEH